MKRKKTTESDSRLIVSRRYRIDRFSGAKTNKQLQIVILFVCCVVQRRCLLLCVNMLFLSLGPMQSTLSSFTTKQSFVWGVSCFLVP